MQNMSFLVMNNFIMGERHTTRCKIKEALSLLTTTQNT